MTSVRDHLLPRLERAGDLISSARPWAVSFLGALVSVCLPVGAYQAGAAPLLVQLSLLVPGTLTLVLMRQGRTWYRWAAVVALAQVVYSEMLTVVLLVAFTWAIHRAWFVEARTWRFARPAIVARRTSPSRGGASK